MTPEQLDHIKNHPKFVELVRRRRRLSWTLTAIMLMLYYGFILLIAFNPEFFRTHLTTHTTIGFPIGVGLIVIAFALTGVYVFQSNTRFDPLVEDLKKEIDT
jgi:uncharacterized membrane protein (DUF485 family)